MCSELRLRLYPINAFTGSLKNTSVVELYDGLLDKEAQDQLEEIDEEDFHRISQDRLKRRMERAKLIQEQPSEKEDDVEDQRKEERLGRFYAQELGFLQLKETRCLNLNIKHLIKSNQRIEDRLSNMNIMELGPAN